MLDLCYVHATSDSIRWRALLESVESRIIFFFFLGGGEVGQQPQNLTDIMSWGKNFITPYQTLKGGW